MQWTDGPNGGFSTGTPWMPVNPNCAAVNAQAAVEQPDSVFHCYRKLIALRKRYPVFREGDFTLLDPENESIFAYVRENREEKLLVVCNFTDRTQPWVAPAAFAKASLLAANDSSGDPLALCPYEARMYLI